MICNQSAAWSRFEKEGMVMGGARSRFLRPAPAAGLVLTFLFLVGLACNQKTTQPAPQSNRGHDNSDPAAMADFLLRDMNLHSPSSGQWLSPRDQLGRVSAWYFGHST